jgi:hypothetical protein
MFGKQILKPDLHRKPVYDSVSNRAGRRQSFACSGCGSSVQLDLEQYIGQPADPDTVLGSDEGSAIRNHFGILARSLQNGWPKVRVEPCARCHKQFLVYVAEFEPSNGWCQGVLQGITELLPSNNSLKSDAAKPRTLG